MRARRLNRARDGEVEEEQRTRVGKADPLDLRSRKVDGERKSEDFWGGKRENCRG